MRGLHVLLGFALSLTLVGAAFAGDTSRESVPTEVKAADEPEIALRPSAEAEGLQGAPPGLAVSGRCEITCFKHSCSIECGPGKEPSCNCRNVKTPGGWQFLPFCNCQKAQNAVPQADAADRTNISKSQGWVTLYKGSDTKCRRIKCTGGSADSGETIGIEVEVDDSSEGALGKGQESDFQGKKIRIKALSRIASYNLNDC